MHDILHIGHAAPEEIFAHGKDAIHELVDTGKTVALATAGLALIGVAAVAGLSLVLNVLKAVLF